MLWLVLAALAVLPFGYLAARSLTSKKTSAHENEKDDCGCFNIKKLLQDKWDELTDLKGRLKSKVEEQAREGVRQAIKGTVAGDMLAIIEKAEAEYGRLKKLYEQCMLEFERTAFKGVVIENSLRDPSILEKLKIEKTTRSGDRDIHNVLVDEQLIPELATYLIDGPWHMHFWSPQKDDVQVVFKGKTFVVKSKDKSTWTEAVTYGKSIGIPDEQLDFAID